MVIALGFRGKGSNWYQPKFSRASSSSAHRMCISARGARVGARSRDTQTGQLLRELVEVGLSQPMWQVAPSAWVRLAAAGPQWLIRRWGRDRCLLSPCVVSPEASRVGKAKRRQLLGEGRNAPVRACSVREVRSRLPLFAAGVCPWLLFFFSVGVGCSPVRYVALFGLRFISFTCFATRSLSLVCSPLEGSSLLCRCLCCSFSGSADPSARGFSGPEQNGNGC